MKHLDKKIKKYSKPELITYGDIKEITKGDCQETPDDYDLGCSGV